MVGYEGLSLRVERNRGCSGPGMVWLQDQRSLVTGHSFIQWFSSPASRTFPVPWSRATRH
jgi:hypothetical protein